jgi:hypothetical protein
VDEMPLIDLVREAKEQAMIIRALVEDETTPDERVIQQIRPTVEAYEKTLTAALQLIAEQEAKLQEFAIRIAQMERIVQPVNKPPVNFSPARRDLFQKETEYETPEPNPQVVKEAFNDMRATEKFSIINKVKQIFFGRGTENQVRHRAKLWMKRSRKMNEEEIANFLKEHEKAFLAERRKVEAK